MDVLIGKAGCIMASDINDTTLGATRIQIQLLRQAGVMRRVAMAEEMTAFALESARMAMQRRHPQASAQEIAFRLCEQRYGTHLAAKVRAAWLAREHTHDIVL
jgi:hypothetical protein